jgi:hypothetical protein
MTDNDDKSDLDIVIYIYIYEVMHLSRRSETEKKNERSSTTICSGSCYFS